MQCSPRKIDEQTSILAEKRLGPAPFHRNGAEAMLANAT